VSDVERLKEQLHQVALEAKQAAGGLAAFRLKFGQHSEQVQSLIAGTATGVDREIVEVLDAASKAVDEAAQELEGASESCRRYADLI
jgi:hypothetical protein